MIRGTGDEETAQLVVRAVVARNQTDGLSHRGCHGGFGDHHQVIPLRNGGAGIALTVGIPVVVADCRVEPALLPRYAVGTLGTYLIPTGGSDQLAYAEQARSVYLAGTVNADGQHLGFNFDYASFGPTRDPLDSPQAPKAANLVVWYTDAALRKLDWTCISYIRSGASTDGSPEYGVAAQYYGSRAWPGAPPAH